MKQEPGRNGIKFTAEAVGRAPHTLRIWEYQGKLPKKLIPERDERGHRFWTDDQIEGIRQWIVDEDLRPGKSLEQYRARQLSS